MHEFRVWSPQAKRLRLACNDATCEMQQDASTHWWSVSPEDAAHGTDYAYLIDDSPTPLPDPRSLWQPNGVHASSRVYDHTRFQWSDARWQPVPFPQAIVYELHIGTFTTQGTFDSAIQHVDHLVDLGITHVEVMPIAAFAGDRGWGYDGVSLFAVAEIYGGPDGFKRFVNACHAHGLAVILDVVYNHFGPVGNYAPNFGPYLTDRYSTPWGTAVNLDQPHSDEARRFFLDNALMWLRDYHVDGLRLDAVHEYIDRSAIHFMEQLALEVDQLEAEIHRPLTLIAESDLNDPRVVRSRSQNGYGIDAQWSDDFHHALFALLCNADQAQGYYRDYGSIEHLCRALTNVFVYDGRFSNYRKQSHGRPVGDLPSHHFLAYIQNHDQVGNRALGERIEHLAGVEAAKVALGLVLLSPFVPMLFMGEEFAASSPFQYFAHHDDEAMAHSVSEGRKREFAEFNFAGQNIPDPEDADTFERSRLHWNEVHQGHHAEVLTWTKALIQLRRSSLDLQQSDRAWPRIECDGAEPWLCLHRGEFRVAVNLATETENIRRIPLEAGEKLILCSRSEVAVESGEIVLPPMTLAVFHAVQPLAGEYLEKYPGNGLY